MEVDPERELAGIVESGLSKSSTAVRENTWRSWLRSSDGRSTDLPSGALRIAERAGSYRQRPEEREGPGPATEG
eukprot:16068-Prymnesium_polylepis.2